MSKTKKIIQYEPRASTDLGAKRLLQILLNHHVCVLNSNTGGGKTFMTIRALGVYQPHAHLLILTTKANLIAQNWQNSIASYNNYNHTHLTSTTINYEALIAKKEHQKIAQSLAKYSTQPLYIIADEGHRLKNPTSKTFKQVKKIADHMPNYQGIIFVTATPITESLLDTMSYLIMAGYYRNKTDFYRQHVIRYDKYFNPIVKDQSGHIHNEWFRNWQEILQQFYSIQSYVDTKKLLPPSKYNELDFKFDKFTQKGYRQIKRDYVNGVYDSIPAANKAQRDYIAQHCEQRLTTLSNIITSPKRPQGPILIFYQYNSDRDQLLNYLPKAHPNYHLYIINGQHKYDVRQVPPEHSLFVCQYQASGEGLNAPWSHCTVFYSPTYSWKNFKQAQGRNIRAGQSGKVYQVRFVVLKTINQHYWYDLIDNKRKFTTNLMKEYLTNND